MPPILYETVAWLRSYSAISFPPVPGESEAGVVPDPARTAHAAPIAGAIIGLAAGLIIVIADALGATAFVTAAAGTLALIVITGGRAEAAIGAAAGRHSVPAIAVAVLLRTGAVLALLAYGAWAAGFALGAACAVSRAAALGFVLLRPADAPEFAPADRAPLQWLAIAGIALAILFIMPFYGLGAAVAGIAAAAGAVALVSAFVSRDAANGERGFAATAELAAEIAFLIAVAAFSTNP